MTGATRRSVLRALSLAPAAALPGCSFFEDLFETDKPPLAGKREAVMTSTRGLQLDPTDHRAVTLPPPVLNAEWTQAGGNPTHAMGNLQLGDLAHSWRKSIGEGGGYRRKITATPVVARGVVFTMDSDGAVSAFDLATGARRWNTDTQPKKDRSTNVGGGLAVVGGTVYAATGRAEALTLDATSGAIGWRSALDTPARSAPTVVEGRLFVPTLDGRLLCLSAADGKRQWTYQSAATPTTVLGLPAPAYADGLVIAGFGSGELSALRAESGTLAWSDSLAAARGRANLEELSAVRALPVVADGVVYVIGVGGLMVALDLRSGRRLWEREAAGQHTPWLAGDWLFVLTMDQTLACLSKSDGRVRWLTQLPRYANEAKSRDPIFWTGPILGGQYLFLAGTTQRLLAVNPVTGQVLGEQDLPDAVSVSPVAAGGKLLVVTDDSTLSALG